MRARNLQVERGCSARRRGRCWRRRAPSVGGGAPRARSRPDSHTPQRSRVRLQGIRIAERHARLQSRGTRHARAGARTFPAAGLNARRVESFQPTDFRNRYALMPADATARTVNMCNIQHGEKADLTPGGAKQRSLLLGATACSHLVLSLRNESLLAGRIRHCRPRPKGRR